MTDIVLEGGVQREEIEVRGCERAEMCWEGEVCGWARGGGGLPGNLFDVGVRVEIELVSWGCVKDAVMNKVVDFVETGLQNFVADFGESELLIEGLKELRLLLERWCEAGQRADSRMSVNVGIGEVVGAAVLGAGALLRTSFDSAEVSITASQVIPN